MLAVLLLLQLLQLLLLILLLLKLLLLAASATARTILLLLLLLPCLSASCLLPHFLPHSTPAARCSFFAFSSCSFSTSCPFLAFSSCSSSPPADSSPLGDFRCGALSQRAR
jgi:hypothetical protein